MDKITTEINIDYSFVYFKVSELKLCVKIESEEKKTILISKMDLPLVVTQQHEICASGLLTISSDCKSIVFVIRLSLRNIFGKKEQRSVFLIIII